MCLYLQIHSLHRNADWNSRFLSLTTALLLLYTWETWLQDATHSLLLLIHKDMSILCFSYTVIFVSTGSIGLSEVPKDAQTTKIPRVLMTPQGHGAICCPSLRFRALWCYLILVFSFFPPSHPTPWVLKTLEHDSVGINSWNQALNIQNSI